MSMIERQIFTIIAGGLAWFKGGDGRRFERYLLGELELTPDEAAQAQLYFAGGVDADGNTVEARPPTLIHGYARTGGPFPCWALILGNERETGTYLNDDALPVDEDGNRFYDPETGEIVDAKTRYVAYTFQIMVTTDHPDVTIYYYHLLKRILLSYHDEFIGNHLGAPTISGADLMPNPQYLPNDVYSRILTLEIEGEECWTEAFEGGVGLSVAGIALEDGSGGGQSGPAGAAGTVGATVTTYTTES